MCVVIETLRDWGVFCKGAVLLEETVLGPPVSVSGPRADASAAEGAHDSVTGAGQTFLRIGKVEN